MIWTTGLPFFSADELRSHGDGSLILDVRFAAALPQLRRSWGRPLNLNSCCRDPAHNASVGGHPRSLHLTIPFHASAAGTMAADISWSTWAMHDRLAFATLAASLGWSVGRARTFVHVDRRVDIGLPRAEYNYAGVRAPS